MDGRSYLTRRQLVATIPVGVLFGIAGCQDDLPGDGGEEGEDNDEEQGTIRVTVLEETEPDVSGDPIEGATVRVNDMEEQTDEEGVAVIDGLEEDEYSIEVDAEGYESYEDAVDFDFEFTTEYNTEVMLSPE